MSTDELNPQEMDALMADLAKRSGSTKPKENVEDDSEDLEAFLARLEADDEKASAAESKVKNDPLAKAFENLDAPGAQESKNSKADEKPEQRATPAARSVDRSPSGGLRFALHSLKWLLISLPVVGWIWLLGAHLSRWIVVGWLVAAVATSVALGLPAWIWKSTSKGHYRYWVSGISMVLLIAMVVPMPQGTAEVLSLYGHWPTTGVSQWAEWDEGHHVRTGNRWVATQVAKQIPHRSPLPEDAQLGSQMLGVEAEAVGTVSPTQGGTAEAKAPTTPNKDTTPTKLPPPARSEETQDEDSRNGQHYPDLALSPSASSSSVNPCQGKDRCVVVNVAPWCSACKNSLETITALQEKARTSESLGVITVISSAKVAALNEMAATIGESSFLDPEGKVLDALGVRSIPYWLTMDKNKKILASFSGTVAPRDAHFRKLGLD
jgi:hypothetical protein